MGSMAQLLTVLSLISLFGLHASIKHSDFLEKCAHIPDGNYPISPCSHHYLACSGGRGIIRVCPSGLIYNPVRNRCDNKADVATCGVSTTTTTTPLSDITSTTEQQTFDCSGLLPGDYPLQANSCLQQYFTCDANSVGVVRTCPNDLYFDSVNRVCNFFDNIASCSGVTAPQTTVTSTLGPTLPPVEFDCSKRKDGFYPNPARQCSSIYYACTAGEARRLFCGSGLAYDIVTRACQSPDNTFACTGRTTPITSAPTTVTTQLSPVDCVTLPNGLYPNPEDACSRIFFACSDGIADRFVCPGELYFDSDTQSCQRFSDVFACTGVTTTTTTTTSASTTTTPQSDVGFDCTSLADGLYPNPNEICSTFYFICSGSVARRQNCPSGLYYDPEIQRCNSFGNIFVCTGTRPTTTTTTTRVTVTSSPDLDCTNLANGLYPNPRSQCSPIYFYCTNGFAYERRCLDDLFFNPELKICDRYSDIFECTGTRSTPTTTPTPTTPQSDVPFNCAYLPNGNYPNPSQQCSNMFFTCSNGKATIRTCPQETYFDPELRLCLKFSDVPACSGTQRTTTTATTTTALSDVTTPFFQCGNMPNGNYPLGSCENVYVSCVDGNPSRRECPPNLFYDYTINECDYIYRIPGCGGQRTTTALSDVTVTTTTPAPGFDCSRLADGKYPNPDNVCYSDFYYVCAGGRTSRMYCPAGLIYDPNAQECRFRRHAKPCKKSSLGSL